MAVDPAGTTLVIVEVKTRASPHPPPEDGFTRRKGRLLMRLAARLQRRREFRNHSVRLDAIAVVWPPDGEPDVRHYQDAFDLDQRFL